MDVFLDFVAEKLLGVANAVISQNLCLDRYWSVHGQSLLSSNAFPGDYVSSI
jgi:hypothetical protein